jgi:hypothetical protein
MFMSSLSLSEPSLLGIERPDVKSRGEEVRTSSRELWSSTIGSREEEMRMRPTGSREDEVRPVKASRETDLPGITTFPLGIDDDLSTFRGEEVLSGRTPSRELGRVTDSREEEVRTGSRVVTIPS